MSWIIKKQNVITIKFEGIAKKYKIVKFRSFPLKCI